ncbi:TIR domain-containing protein [Cupriavidus yeoncheonensis]|uniref:TIR domain-containing protein n=1 Tax=Cupriavidus yeoncheonensis TaxID=1462994 RepID=UPI001BA9C56F|nr:TIR domain-containing protein [Cupriavidus yeoncheonensis]
MLKVFLSYAKEDFNSVKPFYDYLQALGLDPWMDSEKLLPGQRWEREIEKALNAANVVIVFISPNSVSKRSFVTREANTAVSNLRYKKQDDIYLIPILLEPCEVPESISEHAQYIDLNTAAAREKVVSALFKAAEQQKIAIINGVNHGPYIVFPKQVQEQVAGRPGHDVVIDYPEFQSTSEPGVAESLSALFSGRAHTLLMQKRTAPWDVRPDLHPEVDDSELNDFHANGRWDGYRIALATEHILSISYSCSWYGAGAAHSNQFSEAFNFRIKDGKAYPFKLTDLFSDHDAALEIISDQSRKSIAKEYWEQCGQEITKDEWWAQQFLDATAPTTENFETFTVEDGNKLSFYFAPYRVAAYSFGTWVVDVSFYDLRGLMKQGPGAPLFP